MQQKVVWCKTTPSPPPQTLTHTHITTSPPHHLFFSLFLPLSPSLSLNPRLPSDERRTHGASDVHATGAGAWQHGCLATATSGLAATTTATAAAADVGVTQQLGVSSLLSHNWDNLTPEINPVVALQINSPPPHQLISKLFKKHISWFSKSTKVRM